MLSKRARGASKDAVGEEEEAVLGECSHEITTGRPRSTRAGRAVSPDSGSDYDLSGRPRTAVAALFDAIV